MAIVAALVAALFYSLASLLQQWEAERQPPDRSLSPSLLTRLARRPRWVAGLGFDMAGYVMQWTALTLGSLVVVQPLLVVGLLFALPMKAHLSEYRLHGWDWSGALLVTSGLAVFLVVSRPGAGHADVKPLVWVVVLCGGACPGGGAGGGRAGRPARDGGPWPTPRPPASSTESAPP